MFFTHESHCEWKAGRISTHRQKRAGLHLNNVYSGGLEVHSVRIEF